MPRRRMIDPEIWRNEKVSRLPDAGRLLFIGIFSQADDDGRLKASPRFLMANIFPYDKDKTEEDIRLLRDQCAELGLIRLYTNGRQEYLDIPGWRGHQQIRKDRYNPSNLPTFEESQPTTNVKPTGNHLATNDIPNIVKSSLVKSNRVPTVPAEQESAEPQKATKQKPHQKEAGAFLSFVENHEKVPLLSREKLIHLVRTKLFKDMRSTPGKLFECYLWLKDNDFFCRNKAPPQVIGAMPDRYPSWLEGKLKPNVGGKSGEYRRHPEEPRPEVKYDWEETRDEPDDTS